MAQNENLVANSVVMAPEILTEEMLALMSANTDAQSGFFTDIAHDDGVADSPLKARVQLDTDDVVMRLLHVETAHITRAVDENGVVSDFAIVAFDEFPANYYQGGARLTDFILSWAKACGDEFTTTAETVGNKKIINFKGNRMLPGLNKAFVDHAHPAIVLKWRDGKQQKYVDVLAMGG